MNLVLKVVATFELSHLKTAIIRKVTANLVNLWGKM